MTIKPIDDKNSDFDKVTVKSDTLDTNITPHCKQHGAMNKVSVFEGGGYWRCCVTDATNCRAGCIQVNN